MYSALCVLVLAGAAGVAAGVVSDAASRRSLEAASLGHSLSLGHDGQDSHHEHHEEVGIPRAPEAYNVDPSDHSHSRRYRKRGDPLGPLRPKSPLERIPHFSVGSPMVSRTKLGCRATPISCK